MSDETRIVALESRLYRRNEERAALLKELTAIRDDLSLILWGIGAPLNDNKLHYTAEQRQEWHGVVNVHSRCDDLVTQLSEEDAQ